MAELADTETPADAAPLDGQSLIWCYFGDNRMFLIGPRPAVLQNMLAELGQGVFDHSVWFADTAARHKAFLPRGELVAPAIADLLALDDAGFRQVFAGSPIKRIGRNRMVRNAAIAAGNSGDARFRARLEALALDESPMVADAAAWALAELAS